MSQIRYAVLLYALTSTLLQASPSSVFWTNCTTKCTPPKETKLALTNIFSLSGSGHPPAFPPDLYVEYGLPEYHGITGEVGVDFLGGKRNPLYFNGKVAIKEGWLFSKAPSVSVGIFSVGTKTHGKHRTNQNVVDCALGHSLPKSIGGTLYVGVFSGSKAMGKNHFGAMIAFERPFHRTHDKNNRLYHKWAFSMDYATGKNSIGGGGFALSYYFTPKISMQTGPVWFNSRKINGPWKWLVQIGVAF